MFSDLSDLNALYKAGRDYLSRSVVVYVGNCFPAANFDLSRVTLAQWNVDDVMNNVAPPTGKGLLYPNDGEYCYTRLHNSVFQLCDSVGKTSGHEFLQRSVHSTGPQVRWPTDMKPLCIAHQP